MKQIGSQSEVEETLSPSKLFILNNNGNPTSPINRPRDLMSPKINSPKQRNQKKLTLNLKETVSFSTLAKKRLMDRSPQKRVSIKLKNRNQNKMFFSPTNKPRKSMFTGNSPNKLRKGNRSRMSLFQFASNRSNK